MPEIQFFCWYSGRVSEILKRWVVVFLTLNICRKLRISVINSSQWNISLVNWGKVIHACEMPNFCGLHKNKNCEFPLRYNSKSSGCFTNTYSKSNSCSYYRISTCIFVTNSVTNLNYRTCKYKVRDRERIVAIGRKCLFQIERTSR